MFCLTARPERRSVWIEEQKVPAVLDILRSISSVHFCRGGHESMTFSHPAQKALNLELQLSCLCIQLYLQLPSEFIIAFSSIDHNGTKIMKGALQSQHTFQRLLT